MDGSTFMLYVFLMKPSVVFCRNLSREVARNAFSLTMSLWVTTASLALIGRCCLHGKLRNEYRHTKSTIISPPRWVQTYSIIETNWRRVVHFADHRSLVNETGLPKMNIHESEDSCGPIICTLIQWLNSARIIFLPRKGGRVFQVFITAGHAASLSNRCF